LTGSQLNLWYGTITAKFVKKIKKPISSDNPSTVPVREGRKESLVGRICETGEYCVFCCSTRSSGGAAADRALLLSQWWRMCYCVRKRR